MTELKDRGLVTKFEVKKLTNPAKQLNVVVLEFDDPIARVGILAWAREMNRHGYTKVYSDVISKLDSTKSPRLLAKRRRFTPAQKQEAIVLAKKHGVSEAARKVGIVPRLLFSWAAKAKSEKVGTLA